MASEHHIFKTFDDLKIRHCGAGLHTWIYRYRDNLDQKTVDDVIKNELKLSNVIVNNGSSQGQLEIKKY